jgi:hypothetical protein
LEDNPVFRLSDKLAVMREDKSRTEDVLKEINERIEQTEYELSELMAENDLQNFTRNGQMFYLKSITRASAIPSEKCALFDSLKRQGFGGLVYETVNANSLSSFVKEQMEENGDVLPGWLNGLVNVRDFTTVGVRKAAR